MSMRAANTSENLVSMVDLKNLARAKLPPSSALRDLILSEPDYLPDGEVMIKVRMYSKLLYRELNHSNPSPMRSNRLSEAAT
jgi:hypothetical protein